MSTLALRISCPDRPGALGAVATALGRAGTNIVSLDVVERAAGLAIDDLVVVGWGAGPVVDAVESVPGVVVELVHAVAPATDPVSPLDVAARLVGAAGDMYRELMGGVPDAFAAGWCAVVHARSPQPRVLAQSAAAPSLVGARTPWLPLETARRLDAGPWVPDRWSLDPRSASFVVAPLVDDSAALLAARPRGPRFREREVADLANLARVAAGLLTGGATVTSADGRYPLGERDSEGERAPWPPTTAKRSSTTRRSSPT